MHASGKSTMNADEPCGKLGESTEQLVTLAREELGEMPARHRSRGLFTLAARDALRARRRKGLALSFAAVAALVALVLASHAFVRSGPARTLSYAVDGGRIDAQGAVEASGTKEPKLLFSDGTEVVFRSGAQGRVKSVGEHGARIAVTGKVHVKVVHWRGSQWLFDAGPFLITVTGTAFTAEWRDAEGRLDVALEAGSLAVSGPLSDEAIALRAGQRLRISTREKEVVIRELGASPEPRVSLSDLATDAGSTAAPADGERAPDVAPPAQPAPAPGASASVKSSWMSELAAGNFAAILRQAEQRGLDDVLAQGSSDELAALSDAARYSRREDVARRALTAQRRRFPESRRASDAAFLLGRLEEAAQRPELALDWYDRCLRESPHGTYVSEALGRKMTVIQRLYGDARARPIAEEYLRRFSSGTYAAAARALIRAP
jgi:hypothetical protein